jgi:hypothetical protein
MQAIYGFRGAVAGQMETRFKAEYKGSATAFLRSNYRWGTLFLYLILLGR